MIKISIPCQLEKRSKAKSKLLLKRAYPLSWQKKRSSGSVRQPRSRSLEPLRLLQHSYNIRIDLDNCTTLTGTHPKSTLQILQHQANSLQQAQRSLVRSTWQSLKKKRASKVVSLHEHLKTKNDVRRHQLMSLKNGTMFLLQTKLYHWTTSVSCL